MRELSHVIASFAAAAFPPAFFVVAYTSVVEASAWSNPTDLLILLVGFYAGTFFIALLFGGIPFVVLRTFNLVRWWSATAVGTLIGLGLVYAFGTAHLDVVGIVGLPCSGAVSGFLFWVMWRKGQETSGVPVA